MTSLTVVLVCLALSGAPAQDPRAEAERLANAGSNAEALKRFQAIAAANPDDVTARLWIGRLHLRMGHPARAAGVFESILATNPENVDALVGLGFALTDAGRGREAADVLSKAEALAGERTDVLEAQGRFHASQGRRTLALAYYDRALAAEPNNMSIRAAADALRAARGHRADVGYDLQAFDPDAGSMHAGTVAMSLRLSDPLRLLVRGQVQHFEGDTEGRGGAGLEWMARPDLRLRAGAIVGGQTWLPGKDVFADVAFSARKVRWTFALRYFDFDGADLWIGGPGIAFDLSDRVSLEAEYMRGRTGFDLPLPSRISDNFMVGLRSSLSDTARVGVAYRRGIDYLDWMTADRLGAEDANTIGGDISVDVNPFVTLSGGYDLQDRPGDFRVHRARAWLSYRF